MDEPSARDNVEPRRRTRRRSSVMRSGDDLPAPPDRAAPANIRETETWRASERGIKRFWGNYKDTLSTSFQGMTRYDQEGLITKMCVIVTIGVTGIGFLIFYNFIPRNLRVILLPAAIFGAWWAANKVVAPVVLARLENILNKE